jgi:hypothetical protein
MARAEVPRRLGTGRLRFRALVALHHLLQPLARWVARNSHRYIARRQLDERPHLPSRVRREPGGVVVVEEDRPRAELASGLVEAFRCLGIRAVYPSGWEDYDARLVLSPFAYGELQTSSHPEGFVQIRVRFRPRRRVIALAAAAAAAAFLISPVIALVPIAIAGGVGQGALRARRLPARVLPAEAK